MFAKWLLSLVTAIAFLAAIPAATAANFSGWTRTYDADAVTLVSPQDQHGVVQLLLAAAQHEPGDIKVEFRKFVDSQIAGMGADIQLAKRSGTHEQGHLLLEVLTVKTSGVDVDALIFCYDTGGRIYQIGVLAYISAIPETDPRVNHALDFIATIARHKFRLSNPRDLDRTAPNANKVTTYNNSQAAPPPPAPPAAPPPQQTGKKCERRPVWGFRVSYWCQPSGICPDRVIKDYETVCE